MPNKITPAVRTNNITYAVRDIVVLANQVAKSGKEMLYLNIGDPNLLILNHLDILLKQHIRAYVGKQKWLCSFIRNKRSS